MNKRKRGMALLLLAFLLSVALAIPRAEPVNAATPRLSKTKTTLVKGGKVKLKVIGAAKKARWSTNKKKVATVNSRGVVRAKTKGTAKITAKVGKKRLVCRVTVRAKKKVLTPTLSDERISLNVGNREQLKILGASQVPRWWSTNDNVATVDGNGVVRGVSPGECRVYAELPGTYFMCFVSVFGKAGTTVAPTVTPGISGTATPTPEPTGDPVQTQTPAPTRTPTPGPTVTVSPTVGPTQTPRPTYAPTVRPTVTSTPRPTTRPTSVPTVRPTNTPAPRPTTTSAPTPTTAPTGTPTSTPEPTNSPTSTPAPTDSPIPTNTPTSTPTPTNTPMVTPTPTGSPTSIPVESFQLDKNSLQIYEGESEKLTYSITPENASDKTVKFSSSDSEIANVGSDGTVEAKTPGGCTITATCGGFESNCAVNILKKEIILDKNALSIQECAISQLNYELRLPDSEKSTVSFSSSNEDVVLIEGNGRIIAKSSGKCVATVRCGEYHSDCAIEVIGNEFSNIEGQGISYQAGLVNDENDGGVVVCVINNGKKSIYVKANCRFYDTSGNLIGDLGEGQNSNPCLEPGNKCYLRIKGPYMPPKYEVYFEVMGSALRGHSDGIEMGSPEIVGEYRNVRVEVKNNSSAYSKSTKVSCVFYKDGNPVGISYKYPQIDYIGALEVLDFSSSKWSEYDSFKINLEYSST